MMSDTNEKESGMIICKKLQNHVPMKCERHTTRSGTPQNSSKRTAHSFGLCFSVTLVIFVVLAGGCAELRDDEDQWSTSATSLDGIFALDEELRKNIPGEFLSDIELRDAYLRGYFIGVHRAFEIYPKPGETIWEIEFANDPPLLGDQEIDGKYKAEAKGRHDGYGAATAMFDSVTGKAETQDRSN